MNKEYTQEELEELIFEHFRLYCFYCELLSQLRNPQTMTIEEVHKITQSIGKEVKDA